MKWVSVKTRMPGRDVNVLVVSDHREAGGSAVIRIDRWIGWRLEWRPGYWERCAEVSFWMPLPEIPGMLVFTEMDEKT